MQMNAPITLRANPALASLARAALAKAHGTLNKTGDSKLSKDRVADLIMRNVSVPTNTTEAIALQQVVVEFLEALTPMSAGAALLQQCLQIQFNNAATISIPGFGIPVADFVPEMGPFPVVQAVSSAGQLVSYKFGVITALTTEMLNNPGAEDAIRQILIECVGPALDKNLFSTNAAVPQLKPAGLLNGIAPLTASSSTGNEAMYEDLEALGAAVSSVAGNGTIVIAAAPKQAIGLAIRMPSKLAWPVYASTSLADGTVIVVATNALASAVGVPTIDTTKQASLHMDTQPLPLVSSPATVAALTRGTYQTDSVALKLRLPVSWALRSPNAISYITGATW
jgi:hypothetical protein